MKVIRLREELVKFCFIKNSQNLRICISYCKFKKQDIYVLDCCVVLINKIL